MSFFKKPQNPTEALSLPTVEEITLAKKTFYNERCLKYYTSVEKMAPVAIRDTMNFKRKGSEERDYNYFDIATTPMRLEEKMACPQYEELVASMKKSGIKLEMGNWDSTTSSFLYYNLIKNTLHIP